MEKATIRPYFSPWLERLDRPFFRLLAAFVLGGSVGFLYRPLDDPHLLIVPPPSVLSLWGQWEFPVLLLFSLIVGKIYLFLWKGRRSLHWKEVLTHCIVAFLFLLLLVCGIAPADLLNRLHLLFDNNSYVNDTTGYGVGLLYTLLNPLVVGMATSFIFVQRRQRKFPEEGLWAASIALAGNVTLFLVLVSIYGKLVVSPRQGCHSLFCTPPPSVVIFGGAPLWISISFVLALLGAIFGGFIWIMLLKMRKEEEGER